ncbi:Endonuclease/exonuclease/phosphatase [Podospora australis]|uniref:DNA-(apurinic or apyrimidinic site) endonuclease 2 n=1 Tax=Podospora australis TaxID=1536484 RepID=A0AAN6WKA9_9PEZI|nr:Endonuclease/exonuclease/phosphatase [Podospora australis]
MPLRITTWNGMQTNPFSYQPWRESRTFQAMFDTLEADIVVMQETKIQRKDLKDDMVLVPGWDVYFSLPKYKKGYSGVAIYTRSSKCSPIRAEEGITGVLCPPNSSTKFKDLPEDQQVGGYPKPGQLSEAVDSATLDSEGRCVVLEFPAFVLIGVYSPANRDESRDEFRQAYIDAIDIRVRNLIAMGKQVFLCGDLNIIRSELDTAGLAERLRKEGATLEDFFSVPSRRFMNQIVFGGRVFGERDEGREEPVLWDLCREFHPDRTGMYTCWETRKNARPGNFGSRIDYVLCSSGIRDWFLDSNIQEGLLGSDHCPVYATLGDRVTRDGREVSITDLMNPEGMFKNGARLREWCAKDLLPASAKLIPEFNNRRSIKDMFFTKPTSSPKPNAVPTKASSEAPGITATAPLNTDVAFSVQNAPTVSETEMQAPETRSASPAAAAAAATKTTKTNLGGLETASPEKPTPWEREDTNPVSLREFAAEKQAASRVASPQKHPATTPKRAAESTTSSSRPQKKGKASLSKESSSLAQSSLKGFFKPKTPTVDTVQETSKNGNNGTVDKAGPGTPVPSIPEQPSKSQKRDSSASVVNDTEDLPGTDSPSVEKIFDPIENKESWSKLLGKRVVPKCEHGDDCQSMLTRRPGVNCGRSFFVCPRPLGPSGQKESGTEFRCRTFIWSSDWNGRQ